MTKFLKFNNSLAFRRQILLYNSNVRTFYLSKSCFAEKVSSKTEENFDIVKELSEPELAEEEILQKRFKSRLPEKVYRQLVAKEPLPLEFKFQFQKRFLRKYYALHGRNSKLNPGICWPTKEEMLETIEYDKILEPPLADRIKKVEEARLAEENRKKAVEAEVEANMANSDKWIAEYHAKIEKKREEALVLKQKKEKLIDEISEYLGYEIDPRDPRFQEAVEQRDKEQKKARKVKKQQESYDKMLSKLKQMADK